MAIHHDKSVYGKLRPLNEEYGEEDLIAAARALNGKTEETFGGEVAEKADGKRKNTKSIKKL